MTQAMKGQIKVSYAVPFTFILGLSKTHFANNMLFRVIQNAAFWFRLGLKYYERVKPEEIERHLIMLALFYATRDKKMMAEGLYRQVLDQLEHDKENSSLSYNLVMALNFYGRMLMANPKRQREAQDYIKQSE